MTSLVWRAPALVAPLLGVLLWLAPPPTRAEEASTPRLAIIIDDLGDRWAAGQRAIALPGHLTYAILPGTPQGARLARLAQSAGREVILHQPMETLEGKPLGHGGLVSGMSREEFLGTLRANLDALPQARGVNNHMGSALTRDSEAMGWLMSELHRRGGLYFIDSRTTTGSVARRVARKEGLATAGRDVFLDHVRTNDAIEHKLIEAMQLAHQRGSAIAIGHPYPETLTVLEETLPRMERFGIRLVTVSQLLEAKQQRRDPPWHVSLFPSPTVAKN
ncbi:MAG TPA: divergent polysaccharide deacetylase family protein [Gammaproteobacteria bacterium]